MSDSPQTMEGTRQPNSSEQPGQHIEPPSSAPSNPIDDIKAKNLEAQVIETLRTVYDPEIPVNIYEMGLIYTIRTTADGVVYVAMTLTSPACPVAGALPIEGEQKIKSIEGVTTAQV